LMNQTNGGGIMIQMMVIMSEEHITC
ncbi:hypothetical protein A2U01_0025471, partial [Trifolium medium]|nr:hypothetical protein [Trifolium medium]